MEVLSRGRLPLTTTQPASADMHLKQGIPSQVHALTLWQR